MTAPVLRPFEPDDRAGVERIADEIVRDGSVFPFEDMAGVLEYWFAPRSVVVVAAVGDEVVGTYALKPNLPDRGAHVCNAGYMVAEAARGRGVGRALCEHSLRKARELGYRLMQFNQVVATNLGAVHLWQELGFRIVGTIPGSFRHPDQGYVDAHVMVREL